MADKITINIGSLVKHMHVTADYDEAAVRKKITQTLLQAVEASQRQEEINCRFKSPEFDEPVEPGRKILIFGVDHEKPIGFSYREGDNCFEDLPAGKKERVGRFIDLMNWAKLYGDDELYDRATTNML